MRSPDWAESRLMRMRFNFTASVSRGTAPSIYKGPVSGLPLVRDVALCCQLRRRQPSRCAPYLQEKCAEQAGARPRKHDGIPGAPGRFVARSASILNRSPNWPRMKFFWACSMYAFMAGSFNIEARPMLGEFVAALSADNCRRNISQVWWLCRLDSC